jgi:hypothetical protein
MRTIPELLKVMLENQQFFYFGLCGWAKLCAGEGLMNNHEYLSVIYYIEQNKPMNARTYYWTICELQPRIDWINEQLKKFEE